MFLKIYQLTCIYFSITLETVLPYFLSSFVHISESFLVSGCCLFWDKKEHTLHRSFRAGFALPVLGAQGLGVNGDDRGPF